MKLLCPPLFSFFLLFKRQWFLLYEAKQSTSICFYSLSNVRKPPQSCLPNLNFYIGKTTELFFLTPASYINEILVETVHSLLESNETLSCIREASTCRFSQSFPPWEQMGHKRQSEYAMLFDLGPSFFCSFCYLWTQTGMLLSHYRSDNQKPVLLNWDYYIQKSSFGIVIV